MKQIIHLPMHLKNRYVELLYRDKLITGTIVDITAKTVGLRDGQGRALMYEREFIKGVKKLDTYEGLKIGDLVRFTYPGRGTVTGYFGEEKADTIEVLSPNRRGEKEDEWYQIGQIKKFEKLG